MVLIGLIWRTQVIIRFLLVFGSIFLHFLILTKKISLKFRLIPAKSFGQFIKNHNIKISREFPGIQFDSREWKIGQIPGNSGTGTPGNETLCARYFLWRKMSLRDYLATQIRLDVLMEISYYAIVVNLFWKGLGTVRVNLEL